MPKEITHFYLAARAAARLPEKSPLRRCIGRFPACYSVGSVLPDTPYYTPFGQWAGPMNALAGAVHDTLGEPYAPVVRVLRAVAPRDRDAAVSLMAGALTHFSADAVFHPFVIWFTGFPGPKGRPVATASRAAHHEMESLMDQYYGKGFHPPSGGRFYRLMRRAARSFSGIQDAIAVFFNAPDRLRGPLSGSIFRHGLLQALFFNPGARLLAEAARRLPQGPWTVPAASFYPPALTPRFNETAFAYGNPVTGEPLSASLDELADRAVALAAGTLSTLDSGLAEGDPARFLDGCKGPSLYTGMADASQRDIAHWVRGADMRGLLLEEKSA